MSHIGLKAIYNNGVLKNVVGRNCTILMRTFSKVPLLEERIGKVCVLKMAKGPVNAFDISMMKVFQNKIKYVCQ